MRRIVLLLALAAVAPAAADSGRPAEVAAALRSDPIYVAPARAKILDTAAAGRLRRRIADQDPGRIKIAVIPRAWADADGGVSPFAQATSRRLPSNGALVIVAEDPTHYNLHVTVSHNHVDDAIAAVNRAFDGEVPLEVHLRRAIAGLVEIDPGPAGDTPTDEGGTATAPNFDFPNPNKIVEDVNNTIKFVVVAIVLAVLAPFLFIFVRSLVRGARRREEEHEALADELQALREERDLLGEDIVDLDTATSMPNVPASARTVYEQALDAYDSSALKLDQVDNRRRLEAVRKLIGDGRAAAAKARAAVE